MTGVEHGGRRRALVLLAAAALFVAADLGLRPLVPLPRKSTIFIRDPDLGWRFRPGAADEWDGVPYRINRKGLRGPEVPYDKRPGILRVLYLGDSVTVGAGLATHEETFPFLTEGRLEAALRADVETVNSGVNGYGTWQEAEYLRKEGLRYGPDLVIVCFVLNDFLDNLDAHSSEPRARQLLLSASSRLDRVSNHSALVALARILALRLRFGPDVRAGAVSAQSLSVRALTTGGDAPRAAEVRAHTFRQMAGLASLTRDSRVPVVLVIFPYAFQLESDGRSAEPQAALRHFAESIGVPVLDLLPVLASQLLRDGAQPRDYFLDEDHPSPLGSMVVAAALADFVLDQSLLRPPPAQAPSP